MARSSPQFQIVEVYGETFQSLGVAQRSARAIVAADLAETVKRMIESGELQVIENQIMPKGK